MSEMTIKGTRELNRTCSERGGGEKGRGLGWGSIPHIWHSQLFSSLQHRRPGRSITHLQLLVCKILAQSEPCSIVWAKAVVHACMAHTRTNSRTRRHKNTDTHTDTDTQTHRHTDTQTHRHTDTQTHRHTDTQTHRHTDTQTHRHTDTKTQRHTDTQTDTHTHQHTHTPQHTHTQTLTQMRE